MVIFGSKLDLVNEQMDIHENVWGKKALKNSLEIPAK